MESDKVDVMTIEKNQKEVVYDMSFDWFGKRLAVITGDRKIKIYVKNNEGNFVIDSEFTGHSGPIWRVKWAHPDFGSVIATCSFDKAIIIWEEDEKIVIENGMERKISTWTEKSRLFARTDSVEDIKFSPKHMGFIIGAVYANGYIILWELQSLTSAVKILEEKLTDRKLTSISWNKNYFDPPMFLIGMGPPSYVEEREETSAMKQKKSKKGFSAKIKVKEPEPITNKAKFKEDPTLNCLQLYTKKDKWNLVGELRNDNLYHSNGVHDISWASLNARSYHSVVSCGRDGLIVWKFNLKSSNEGFESIENLSARLLKLGDHSVPMRVSWNFMSTIIVASSSNHKISIWKKKRNGDWELELKSLNIEKDQQEVPSKN